jgi:hypothetical protein
VGEGGLTGGYEWEARLLKSSSVNIMISMHMFILSYVKFRAARQSSSKTGKSGDACCLSPPSAR